MPVPQKGGIGGVFQRRGCHSPLQRSGNGGPREMGVKTDGPMPLVHETHAVGARASERSDGTPTAAAAGGGGLRSKHGGKSSVLAGRQASGYLRVRYGT